MLLHYTHIHGPYAKISGVRYLDIKRNLIIAVAGTCLSWRIRKDAPNSFNMIDIDTKEDQKLTSTRYDQHGDKCVRKKPDHKLIRNGLSSWTTK